MALLWRQILTLTQKNLLITLVRPWISTPLRAFVLPILLTLLLSFTKSFISPSLDFGIGEPRPVRPIDQVLNAVSGSRNRIVFVTNGHNEGDISTVIDDVSKPLTESGVNTVIVNTEEELRKSCIGSVRGTSRCIAAAVFHSSPTEGDSGLWNYTLRADGALGTDIHVDSDKNDAQIYVLPLQHAIDWSASRMNSSVNQAGLEQTISEYPFTSKTGEQRDTDTRHSFMDMIGSILATPLYLAVALVLYQMTGLIATEREIGMAQLLDTMMPNISRWQPQAARILSHHLAFDILYCPGWITAGAILGAMCFPKTMILIPILFNIFAGTSTTSMAIFIAGFFRKAQLSGIVAIISGLLLAVIAQVAAKSGTAVVVILSLVFPPMNYVFFILLMSRFERENVGLSVFKSAPNSHFSVPAIVFFIFAIYHSLVFPILGAFIERMLYGSASASSRSITVSPSPVAVDIRSFTKEFRPGPVETLLQRWFKRPQDVVLAVDNLDLQAFSGEILVLLGANGSGKSTTLDAVAGLHSATSGEISVNYHSSTEGFGYCPQKNILWDTLTVAEHVKIFDRIKSVGRPGTRVARKDLIEACDLTKKIKSLSKSLSGGQKRKLQLAMMMAGGSTVCCIDEVSSGVDPLSRRKLWDILIAERGRRSMILTTHFLDEADLLADRIAILSRGVLRASGSSVELKHQLGSGYRVHIHHAIDAGYTTKTKFYDDVLHNDHGNTSVYFTGSSVETQRFLQRLECDGVQNYQVNAPTLEDVFFKIEEDMLADKHTPSGNFPQRSSTTSSEPLVNPSKAGLQLLDGNPVGTLQQIWVLIQKRFTILRRNPIPYLVLFAIPIIAAGCSTLFLKDVEMGSCNPAESKAASSGQSSPQYKLVAGPRELISEAALQQIAKGSADAVTMVKSLDEFHTEVAKQFGSLVPGGFWLDSEPTFAWRADGSLIFPALIQNLMDSLLLNVTIASDYKALDVPFGGAIGGLLSFIIYFGLSMAVYPAFLALYPTMERLRGIRAMHYSNGVRATPLWLAYLMFDFVFVLVISVVAVMILGGTIDVWYSLSYVFLIFLLYGIASSLFSYVVALFSSSQLAAFATAAGFQAVIFLLYFIVFMIVFTYVDADKQISTLNIATYSISIVSPVASLARSLFLTLNMFGVSCRNRSLASYPGAIDVYGGPILYLCLQSFILFGILWWKESGFTLNLLPRKPLTQLEDFNDIELESHSQVASTKFNEGLRVLNLRKQFKKHVAVEDVTFGVPPSECFALVGPNGAGKSTTISMIRGDLQPSSRNSAIFIDGVPALRERGKARSRLGVCPQIDPLDSMTVIEHLHFYAKMRGISHPMHNIDLIMTAVGLERFAHRIATKLSGGNKRKLSLAIALMGNPKVLLLDEPSSGMDSVSKRLMWRTLTSIAPGRSLLLTTHSMEEADALATRAGIIAGRMLALGTTEDLRRSYGNAYFVHLVHADAPYTSSTEMARIEGWTRNTFPTATTERGISYGQFKFAVPLGHVSLANIFGALEEVKQTLGIAYYGVSTATLEQIFMNVVGRHEVSEEGSKE
ncbi:ABC transporter [Polyplosphaeria fusca]|uniref:ABC transporter n=1 Tax=Polyplosphaeria fusca TaxID=682080 RepID=A0A9P4QUF3_9PLEO|nr:ABC transporter [Polyplosphaeria fusca]